MNNAAKRMIACAIGVLFTVIFSISIAYAEDKHVGVYYPQPQSEENYTAPLPPMPGVSRVSRIGFVTELDKLQKQAPYAPSYHMFAKGSEGEKLIIVATEEGRYNTLFRLRALLASLTASARLSPLFAKIGQAEKLNFFDLLRMVGFKQVTITNGKDIAHQVHLSN